MKKSTGLLTVAVCLSVGAVLQAIGLARYVGRLPDDWTGIGLYSAALVAFAIGALGFLVQWRAAKDRERQAEARHEGSGTGGLQ